MLKLFAFEVKYDLDILDFFFSFWIYDTKNTWQTHIYYIQNAQTWRYTYFAAKLC